MKKSSIATKTTRRLSRALHPRRRSLPGAAPGTMVADPEAHPPSIHVACYDSGAIEDGLDSLEALAGGHVAGR